MKRVLLTLALAPLIFSFGLQDARAETLSQLLQRQQSLQQKAEQSKQKIAQKSREAANLQDAISNLDEDITQKQEDITNTEQQISLTDEVIQELKNEINAGQTAIDLLNQRLRVAYIGLYEMSQTTTFEVLAQTGSVSDAVTHTQYIQSIQIQLQSDISKQNQLLASLNSKKSESEQQKAGLVSLNKSLTQARSSLARQKDQKNNLLSATMGEQAQYEQLLASIKQESAKLSDEIYRKRQELQEKISSGGTGGYPYTAIDVADPYGFLTRECTSYAAWAWNARFGRSWYRGSGPPGTGDARNWGALAARQGYSTGSAPVTTALVFWPAGPYIGQWGHAAIVEKVNGDGTIDVSEYNWVRYSYSYRSGINPNDSRYGTATYIYP